MELNIHSVASGKIDGTVKVPDQIFAAAYNEALVHQVVEAYRAGARSGNKALKSRSEVRGGGSKPWRQKGLGRARAGSTRNPLWRGGGATFAAKPRNYAHKVNRKMYRGAIRAIVSELIRQERLVVLDAFELESHKTGELVGILKKLELSNALIVLGALSENLALAARNLHWVDVCELNEMNPVSLIGYEKVLVTKDALQVLEGQLA